MHGAAGSPLFQQPEGVSDDVSRPFRTPSATVEAVLVGRSRLPLRLREQESSALGGRALVPDRRERVAVRDGAGDRAAMSRASCHLGRGERYDAAHHLG